MTVPGPKDKSLVLFTWYSILGAVIPLHCEELCFLNTAEISIPCLHLPFKRFSSPLLHSLIVVHKVREGVCALQSVLWQDGLCSSTLIPDKCQVWFSLACLVLVFPGTHEPVPFRNVF